jgi:hypothetical protein
MKSALFVGLSAFALSLAAVVTPTIAAETTAVDATTDATKTGAIQQTPPVTLVSLAQQGYLRNQGIPANQALIQAIAAGQITPETLVRAGIQSNLISSDTLNDRGYLNIVEVQFRDIVQDFTVSSSEVAN